MLLRVCLAALLAALIGSTSVAQAQPEEDTTDSVETEATDALDDAPTVTEEAAEAVEEQVTPTLEADVSAVVEQAEESDADLLAEAQAQADATADEDEEEEQEDTSAQPRIGLRAGGGILFDPGPNVAFGTDPEGPAFTAADGGLTVGGYGSLIFYGGARITRELSLGILAQGFFGAWSPENYGGDLLTGWLFGIGSDYTLALGANALQIGLYIGAWTLDACTGEPTDPNVVVQRGFPRPARCSRPMPSGTFTVDYVFGNGAPPDAVRQGLSIGLMGTMGISDWAETVGEPDAMGNPTLATTTEVSAALSVFVGYELY